MPILTSGATTMRVDNILKVGAVALPSNITEGDLTALRAHFGTDAAFTANFGLETNAIAVKIGGTVTTDTAVRIAPTMTNASGSSIGLQINANFTGATPTATYGVLGQVTFTPPSGTISLAAGFLGIATAAPAAGATISEMNGGYFRCDYNNVGGVVTTGYAVQVPAPTISGSLKPATQYGIGVANQGAAGITTAVGALIVKPTGATNNYYFQFDTNDATAAGTYFGRIPVLHAGLLKYMHIFNA